MIKRCFSQSLNNDGTVAFDRKQCLTPKQKERACNNIGVASSDQIERITTDWTKFKVETTEEVNEAVEKVNVAASDAEEASSKAEEASNAAINIEKNIRIITDKIVPIVDKGFYIVDADGNVCFKYDTIGVDSAEVSPHLKQLLNLITIGTEKGQAYDGYKGNQLSQRLGIVENKMRFSSFLSEYYPEFEAISCPARQSHDLTWVNDFLWDFSGEGGWSVYNENLEKQANTKGVDFQETFKDGTSAILQMKSVDYNHNKLLVGNGKSSYKTTDSYLYVFYEPETWIPKNEKITFDNCGLYKKIDTTELGYKMYGTWGPTDDTIYVSCNLFKDIFLIQLCKGTNQGQFGVYEATDTNHYNGTYRILKNWTMTTQETGNYAWHGGQFYNGSLYVAPNDDSKCCVYKYKLNNDGTIQFDIIYLNNYDSNGNLTYRYIDGLCLRNGKMYAQPLTSNPVQNALLVSNVL